MFELARYRIFEIWIPLNKWFVMNSYENDQQYSIAFRIPLSNRLFHFFLTVNVIFFRWWDGFADSNAVIEFVYAYRLAHNWHESHRNASHKFKWKIYFIWFLISHVVFEYFFRHFSTLKNDFFSSSRIYFRRNEWRILHRKNGLDSETSIKIGNLRRYSIDCNYSSSN